MSSPRKFSKANKIANHIERLKGEIISRWRNEVRSDPELTALIHKLDDQELEDHLPALTDQIIALLRGEATNFEEEAVKHGRQRRGLGYSVVSLLRELQIFRRVLTSMVQEVVGGEYQRRRRAERAHNLIIR